MALHLHLPIFVFTCQSLPLQWHDFIQLQDSATWKRGTGIATCFWYSFGLLQNEGCSKCSTTKSNILNSNILNHMFRSVLTSWTCFPYSRSVPIPSATFDTKCWRQGSAIHPMRRVQNSPLHCAPSTPVDAEKIVEQPLCKSYLTPVWSVFVSLIIKGCRW